MKEEFAEADYSRMKNGLFFRHNAAFIRRQTHLKHLYDLSLQPKLTFSLDSEAFHRMYANGVVFKFVNIYVVDYLAEGASCHLLRHIYNNFLISTDLAPSVRDWIRAIPRFLRGIAFFRSSFVLWERIFGGFRKILPCWILPEATALRLMGAKIGTHVRFTGRITVKASHFLTIGNNVTIGRECAFDASGKIWIEDGVEIPDKTQLSTSHKAVGPYSEVLSPIVIKGSNEDPD